ncbi:MAG: hypothetical protein Q8K86_05050 [Candidatus Nanopelagicaceae bacterium]|nr:hypothetical protein [Candidatus Nanopelagicaceae bacterium]
MRLKRLTERLTHVERSGLLSKIQLEEINRPSYSASKIIAVLNKGGVKSVLVGAQALAHYTGEPRATEDVDLVVSDVDRAVRVVRATWPHLTFDEQEPVVRVRDGKHVVLDLMKPVDLYTLVFKNSRSGMIGGVKALIPTVEMAVAMKYSAMISPHRIRKKKGQDAVDFINLVEATPKLDVGKVGKLVAYLYPGSEAEVRKYVDDVRNDRPLTI